MRRLLTAALCLAAPSLMANDYEALLGAMKKSWPQASTIAVVCDSSTSKASVNALAAAAGSAIKVVVVDVKGPQDMGKALGALMAQKPGAIVLLAGDRVAGDGSAAATFIIQRMAGQKVPVAATTEAGVKQGAVLAVGPGTGGRLLANPKAAALSGVAVPEGATAI